MEKWLALGLCVLAATWKIVETRGRRPRLGCDHTWSEYGGMVSKVTCMRCGKVLWEDR